MTVKDSVLLSLLFALFYTAFPARAYAQTRYTEEIPCVETIDGSIYYGYNGDVLLVSSNQGTYRPGDGWSEIWFCAFAEKGYTSFLTPIVAPGYRLTSATYYCYISGCWGDDIHYNYPVFQMPWGTFNPALLVTHIDYGPSLDPSDANPAILHMPITLTDSYTPGWNSTDVTELLIDDIQNNRIHSQYMLSLHYITDWDLFDDTVVIHAAGFPTSPYIFVEYELIPGPPAIEHDPLTSISNDLMPVTLSASITDDTGISSAVLTYKINEEAETSITMVNTSENLYLCTINPVLPSTGGHFYYKICATDLENNTTAVPDSGWFDLDFVPSSDNDPAAPTTLQNCLEIYPNPFGASCTIEIIDKLSKTKAINIYNLRGQLVKSFTDSAALNRYRAVSWNGQDNTGKQVPVGVYLVQYIDTIGTHSTNRNARDGSNKLSKVLLLK